MRFRIFIVCLLCPLTLCASPPRIASVTFSGNAAFTPDELLGVILLKPGSVATSSELHRECERLEKFYRAAGWLNASVAYEQFPAGSDSIAIGLRYQIREGLRYTVDTVEARGAGAFGGDTVSAIFRPGEGMYFSQQRLEGEITALVTLYASAGYPFAAVTVDSLKFGQRGGPGGVTVFLGIDEGRLIDIDQIRISGNTETAPGVILRELRIGPHERYDEEKVKDIPSLLMRTGLFASVQPAELFYDSAGGGLLLRVTEANTSTFDAIAGYTPANGGSTSGYVHIGMGNLFGTGRKMDILWQRDDFSSQDIRLFYSEPWIFGYPIGISGGLNQRQQDSTYVRRTVEGHADVTFNQFLRFGGFMTHTLVIPSSTLAVQPVAASRTISFGLSLQFDSRNDPVSPTGGFMYGSSYLIGTKKLYAVSPDGQVSNLVQTMTVDAELFRETIPRQVFMAGIHGRQIEGSALGPEDYFRLGGASTIRGYNENELIGSRVAWINTEYRFVPERRSHLFVLFDLGFTSLPPAVGSGGGTMNSMQYGYGAGIRTDSPIGFLTVILAFGKGESFAEGKLHIGLLNHF